MAEKHGTSGDLKSRVAWWVQIGANIAVVAAAGAVMWLAFNRPAPTGAAPLPIYAEGEKIDPIANVDFSKSPRTLVMYLRQDCTYCRKSEPFYQQLTATAQKAGDQALRLVVATTDETQAMTTYLTEHGISVDEVATVKPGALKIPGTPSLLLVDANGTVTKVWRGWLDSKREQEVFSNLSFAVIPASVSMAR